MEVLIFDLDRVVQNPAYPHPDLIADVASVVDRPYDEIYQHYVEEFAGNRAEEEYHLSLCASDDQKARVRGFWEKMHQNMPRATIIPGAQELLEEVAGRDVALFAWTKGSAEIQRGRLASVGLSHFFPEGRIIYSPRKGTVAGLKQDLLPHLPGGSRFIIGDSFEQDILPPLQVGGFTCIWIRWDQGPPKDADLDNPNLIIVESTQDLAVKIKEGLFDVPGDH